MDDDQDPIYLLQYTNCSQQQQNELEGYKSFPSSNCSWMRNPDAEMGWIDENDGNFSRLNDSLLLDCSPESDPDPDPFRFIVLGIGICIVAVLGRSQFQKLHNFDLFVVILN